MHSQDASRLAALYPRWHDFLRIRATLDPHGVFLNGYLSQLLDANGPVPSDTATPEAVKGYGIPQQLS